MWICFPVFIFSQIAESLCVLCSKQQNIYSKILYFGENTTRQLIYISDNEDHIQNCNVPFRTYIMYSCTAFIHRNHQISFENLVSKYVMDIVILFECRHINVGEVINSITNIINPGEAILARPGIHIVVLLQEYNVGALSDVTTLLHERFINNIDTFAVVLNWESNEVNSYMFDRNNNWTLTKVSHNQTRKSDHKSYNLSFHGRELKIVSDTWPGGVDLIENIINNVTIYSGVMPDLLDTLAEAFNFTYKIARNPIFGVVDDNGQWMGMVADVSIFFI